jgi:hypothetical protein
MLSRPEYQTILTSLKIYKMLSPNRQQKLLKAKKQDWHHNLNMLYQSEDELFKSYENFADNIKKVPVEFQRNVKNMTRQSSEELQTVESAETISNLLDQLQTVR